MKNKHPCIECCTGWGDGKGNSCRDTCKRLAAYTSEYENRGHEYHTYFISWIVPNTTPQHIGNATFVTISTGAQLAKDAIHFIEGEIPGAIILSISKLD